MLFFCHNFFKLLREKSTGSNLECAAACAGDQGGFGRDRGGGGGGGGNGTFAAAPKCHLFKIDVDALELQDVLDSARQTKAFILKRNIYSIIRIDIKK